jgi:glycerol-1-phosphate dehydrogenase [NAD(P)+]
MSPSLLPLHEFISRDSASLADTCLDCPECGRVHSIPIRGMKVGAGLIEQIQRETSLILEYTPRRACLIYDHEIEDLIQTQVLDPLTQTGLGLTPLPIGERGNLLDSEVGLSDATAAKVDPSIDLIIGAGSGVICDITKWVATQRHLPYIIYPTAPSMNAYTSITATMTEKDIKTSRLLDPAVAVFMDTDLQASAPMDMIHAGMGDLAARAVCNADWKLASFVHAAYFCSVPYRMTAQNESMFLAATDNIRGRDSAAITLLSEAILKSGLSMTVLEGETSPSSGAEHVISHFWDLLTHIRGLPRNLHGTQVGVGTVIMLAFFEIMRELDPYKIDPLALLRARVSVEEIEAENCKLYGSAAPLFNNVVRRKRVPDNQFCDFIHRIQSKWDAMWGMVSPYAASLASIRTPLRNAGMPLTLSSVRRSRDEAIEALVKGPQYRSRYTLLDLASELGLLPEIADEVLQRSGVMD